MGGSGWLLAAIVNAAGNPERKRATIFFLFISTSREKKKTYFFFLSLYRLNMFIFLQRKKKEIKKGKETRKSSNKLDPVRL